MQTTFQDLKMAEEKRIRLAVIHEILPKEMFVRVLRFLDFKTISIARKTCKEWKRIIDLFNLSKDASRKFFNQDFENVFILIDIFKDFSSIKAKYI